MNRSVGVCLERWLARVCLAVVLLTQPLLSPLTASAEEQLQSEDGSPATLVSRYHKPHLRLRGDYEPNNLILLVWQPEWEDTVKQVALAAAKEVPVHIMIPRGVWGESSAFRRWAKAQCLPIGFHRYDTAWVRDYGPIQVMEGNRVTWRDFAYDNERPLDDEFPISIASHYRVPLELSPGRLDGGGLVSNGRGLCVMTEATVEELAIPENDPDGLERFLGELGCKALATIYPLPDEQTGHADVSVQFLGHDTVAVAEMDPQMAPVQAELLDRSVKKIQAAAKLLGIELRVVRVPMTHHGEVFYSYVNAVRAGSSLLVPSYKDVPPYVQRAAYEAFSAALPDLEIIPIQADEVVEYGGALHCITLGLQVPDPAEKRAKCQVKLARKRVPRARARRVN